MKLECIILIILAVGFYYTNILEFRKDKNRENFINDNLKISSKVITRSGILGYVTNINKNEVTIVTGEVEKPSYLIIEKSYIENILE